MAESKNKRKDVLVVGAQVSFLATKVKNEQVLKRMYGNQWNKVQITGTVTEWKQEKPDGGRVNQTYIYVDYEWAGQSGLSTKLMLRNVKAGPAPTDACDFENHPVVRYPPNTDQLGASPSLLDMPTEPQDRSDDDASSADDSVDSADRFLEEIRRRRGLRASAPLGQSSSNSSSDDEEDHQPPVASVEIATINPSAQEAGEDFFGDDNPELPKEIQAGDVTWKVDNDEALGPLNGHRAPFRWVCRDAMGNEYFDGSHAAPHQDKSVLPFFLMMCPPACLNTWVKETNIQLAKAHKKMTDRGEVLRFLGVLILITRFEFGNRRDLWSNVSTSRFIPSPKLGQTGMSRGRFDDLFSFFRWSHQPDERPEFMTAEAYRWMLIEDCYEHFNVHRVQYFIPSSDVVADESIHRWYGGGGHWINYGLPHYVAMDRKPESGMEVQNLCCGKSGVLLQLILVKSARQRALEEDRMGASSDENHGTFVLKQLCRPFQTRSCRRGVRADSWFASVQTAVELHKMGFVFIGPIKTATKHFPLDHLRRIVLEEKGETAALVATVDGCKLVAMVHADRDRQYFISTDSGIERGIDIQHRRLRQVAPVETHASPVHQEVVIPQPKACSDYFKVNDLIDRHNRQRQDDLDLEKKIETKRWDMRMGCGFLGMVVIDTKLVYEQSTRQKMSNGCFFSKLAEELIDNPYILPSGEEPGRRSSRRSSGASSSGASVASRGNQSASTLGSSGVGLHLTPAKRKKAVHDAEGNVVGMRTQQLRCHGCGKCTIRVCSECVADSEVKESSCGYCDPINGRVCFQSHMRDCHGMN